MARRLECMFMRVLMISLALIAWSTVAGSEESTLTGAGGTAVYPVLSKWAEAYKQETGAQINYQAIGSGGGIAQIKAKTVAFGNSDKPLKPEELKESNLAQFPIVLIGIIPVVNIPNFRSGDLTLDGTTLADIFLGKITKWNDPALRALNPRLSLPGTLITVVHRSDGSGTTFNFADYLSKVSPEWKSKVGADTSVSWPTGVGGKGNAGVAAYVQQVSSSIGYVEYAYALENKMTTVRMKNRDGKVVDPNLSTFEAAAANADFTHVPDFYLILTDQPGAGSWPITAGTWILMRKDAPKSANEQVIRFMTWCLAKGQPQARALQYVPLPENTIQKIKEYWKVQLGL
jgi:phosphate transport system substrate-binding protein